MSATRSRNCSSAGCRTAVGLRDLEQAVENVFEHSRPAAEDARDLSRIDFVSGRVLLRQLEDAPDIGLLGGRYAEYAPECVDFVARYGAVGFRHLGAERNDGDGENDSRLLVFIRSGPFCAIEQHVAGDGARERADRTAAEQETGGGAAEFAPDGHDRNH